MLTREELKIGNSFTTTIKECPDCEGHGCGNCHETGEIRVVYEKEPETVKALFDMLDRFAGKAA